MWFNQKVEHCKLYDIFYMSVVSKEQKQKSVKCSAILQSKTLYSLQFLWGQEFASANLLHILIQIALQYW